MKNTSLSVPYFNSIKVQLELIAGAGSMLGGLLFQFHKGTIRTLNYAQAKNAYANFNSIKVQLELTLRGVCRRLSFISIP